MTNDERQKNKDACRDWYRRNRARKALMAIRRKQDIARYLDECKSSGCRRCGERDVRCLVFHHRDPKTKVFDLARGYCGQIGMDAIRKEVAKCDVLCANCHRKHHWEERQAKTQAKPQ
jgi:hypothetical protein